MNTLIVIYRSILISIGVAFLVALTINSFTITDQLMKINKNLESINISIQENTKVIGYDPNSDVRNNEELPCLE